MPEVLILNTDDCCYGVLRVRDAHCRLPRAYGGRRGCSTTSTIWAVIAAGIHLFPFRTEKLSPPAPMVLGAQAPGRVGRRPPFPQIGNPRARVSDRDRSLKASASRPHAVHSESRRLFLHCAAWISATATSCCARGRRTTCRRSSWSATTSRFDAGSRPFQCRIPPRTGWLSSAARCNPTSRRSR